jgi:hypothetical protein
VLGEGDLGGDGFCCFAGGVEVAAGVPGGLAGLVPAAWAAASFLRAAATPAAAFFFAGFGTRRSGLSGMAA